MKVGRLGLIALGFTVFVSNAYAQEAPKGGAFVGLNYSYFATQPEIDTDPKADVVVGVFGVLRRDKALKIQPELQYSRRSVDINLGDFSGQRTSYFNMGLFLRSKLYKGLYSLQGVQYMIPVASTITLLNKDIDVKDNVNSDVSLVVGVGHQFGRIGIEGRWDAGFKRLEDVPVGGSVKRNRAITLIGILGF